MQGVVAVVLALCVCAVLSQHHPGFQVDLYPQTADGFSVVMLDDMSFCTELNIQTGGFGQNLTYYVYGDGRLRTVYDTTFYVGMTPNEYWHIPFIDFHTFENGTDIWGFGPVNSVNFPLTPNPPVEPPWWHHNFTFNNTYTFPPGFEFQIVVVTTKQFPNNPHGIFFIEEPLEFDGTFFAVHVVPYDPNNVIGFFAGFFPDQANPNITQFGVVRAHFNTSIFQTGNSSAGPSFTFDPAIDVAVIYNETQLVDYNSNFKPLLVHMRNVTTDTSQIYLAVVDPFWDLITLVQSNWQNPSQSLSVNPSANYRPNHGADIVNAVAYGNLLFVGVAVKGQGTGWIDVLNTPSLSPNATIWLPANYSNPQALVIDGFSKWNGGVPTLYVGMNGGPAVLRIDLTRWSNYTYPITGYQMMPFYLHRVWAGQPGPQDIYFTTNEQHAKVFRVAKTDFCPMECMEFGYCKNGKCECNQGFDKRGDLCEWHQLVVEKHIVSERKGGEVALGILFALTFVAGAAGWYLVYQNRRGQYQAV